MVKQAQLARGSKALSPLKPGHHVCIQDQSKTGPQVGPWTQTGVVLEVQPGDAYLVSVNGSRTVTKRNRQFLHQYTLAEDDPSIPSLQPDILSLLPDVLSLLPCMLLPVP